MASYLKLTDKPRALPWRAKVKGGKTRMFPNKADAELWATDWEHKLRMTGVAPSFEERAKLSVGQLIKQYLDEVTPTKGSSVSERAVLERLLGINNQRSKRNAICELTLAQITASDAYAYVRARRQETWNGRRVKDSTIKRELNTLRRIFNVAKSQWYPELLRGWENPFAALGVRLEEEARERRLREGELERLLAACEECRGLNKDYVPIAIFLAIETGMRQQEIFNLTWSDIDFRKRTITITKSKTDYMSKLKGRTIVMTVGAMARLSQLQLYLVSHHEYHGGDFIFPPTQSGKSRRDAFKQSWSDVVKRAGIDDLHFHDLRHEAGSRFDEAGLTDAMHGLMMGHGKRTERDRYTHARLKDIQDKLDRHALGGKTFKEHIEAKVVAPDVMLDPEVIKLFEAATRDPDPANAVEALRRGMELLGIGRVNPSPRAAQQR